MTATTPTKVTVTLPRRGRDQPAPPPPSPAAFEIVQLLALAHAVERATEDGEATRAQIARALGLTRARMTQICKLVFLAPDIQGEIVTSVASLRINERSLRPILGEVDWTQQRAAWRTLRDRARGTPRRH